MWTIVYSITWWDLHNSWIYKTPTCALKMWILKYTIYFSICVINIKTLASEMVQSVKAPTPQAWWLEFNSCSPLKRWRRKPTLHTCPLTSTCTLTHAYITYVCTFTSIHIHTKTHYSNKLNFWNLQMHQKNTSIMWPTQISSSQPAISPPSQSLSHLRYIQQVTLHSCQIHIL